MTAWPTFPKRFVARMLSAHAGLGLIAGALLYILSLSGVLVVFHEDFARWEQPGAPEMHDPEPAAVQAGMENALARHRAEHGELPESAYMVLPTEAAPRMIAISGEDSWFVDADGNLAGEVAHPFSEFLIELHYYLHLPHTLGLIVVGGFGVLMAGLVASGFLAHPRVLRDAFRFRRAGNAQLAEADLHNRLSVWGAPFHFVVPLTGALLGLSILAAFLYGQAFHDGQSRYAFEPTFGSAGVVDDRTAPIADIGAALATLARERPDVEPWYLDLEYPGTEGQNTKILSRLPRRLIFGEYYQFDAAGGFVGQVGLENGTIGQQAIAGVYQLHFGSFGGLPVKLAYALLGLALCVIVASGVRLWLIKRAARGKASPRLEKAWSAILWGSPALLALTGLGSVAGLLPAAVLIPVFWIGLALCLLAAPFVPTREGLARSLQVLAALSAAAAVAVHFARHADAFTAPPAWGVSGGILVAALLLALPLIWRPRLAAPSLP